MADQEMNELNRLAGLGEHGAVPMPASRARQLADRRRRGRHVAMAVGALAVAVLAGTIAVGAGSVMQTTQPQPPPVAGPPKPPVTTPATGPSLTERNLISVSDVPVQDPKTQKVVQTGVGLGRPVERASLCFAAGTDTLGARETLSASFRFVFDDPDFTEDPTDATSQAPVLYTEALQFDTADGARRARETIASWLNGCDALRGDAERLDHLGFGLTEVPVADADAAVAEVVYRLPGESEFDEAYWESVGITSVEDRLMITVYVHYGTESYASLEPGENEYEHPQVALAKAAAKRLRA